MSTYWTVTVAVGNIRANPAMQQTKVVADAKTLCGMGKVVLAVEISLPRYNRAFRNAAGAVGLRSFFEQYPVQVAVPNTWGVHVTHHTLTRAVPWIPQPARMANVVYNDQQKVAFIATHLTNGAWGPKWKPFRAARRRLWWKQVGRLQEIIANLRQLGWNIVIGGDLNTGPQMDQARLHSQQVTLTRAGVMHLLAIPARGSTVRLLDTRQEQEVFTDHAFLGARVRFVTSD